MLTDSACLNLDDNESEIAQLSFSQVYGLWVLLAAGVLLGLLMMGTKRWFKFRRNPQWGLSGLSGGPAFQRTASLETADGDLARRFERGDSRELKKSDLERVNSHL